MARYVQDPVAIEAFGIFITRTFFFTDKYPLFNRICQLEKKWKLDFGLIINAKNYSYIVLLDIS